MVVEGGVKWCDRCRQIVPVEEWKLHIPPRAGARWYWRHEGEQRGVISWDPYHPEDHMCRFTEPVPEKV